ncbi:MAG: 3-keto-disaccharide hydrolase [Chitinophagaceae bacterium]
MKLYLLYLFLLVNNLTTVEGQSIQKSVSLFDGKSFKGWEGDTINTWHIVNHALVGGSLAKTVPHNEFLSTTESFDDFELTLQFKLVGTGFVNAGVQFHSERLKEPAYEMTGYQADLGDGYWASLYDESRRNVTIVRPDSVLIKKILKLNDWNSFTIRSVGRRIRIWLNNVQTVDYTEPDEKIFHRGYIALQVHGGGKVTASYKNIRITRL